MSLPVRAGFTAGTISVVPVLLVRHAHALPRSAWDGDDRDRDLSKKGRRQAGELVPVLRELKPRRVLSSPYLRCVETVRPLAEALGCVVEMEDRLAEGAGAAAYELLFELSEENPVMCSHGDVIPELLDELVYRQGLDLGPRPRLEKGSVWVLERSDAGFATATYLPPPA
jgi:phosphohistidine phosphatase SixA